MLKPIAGAASSIAAVSLSILLAWTGGCGGFQVDFLGALAEVPANSVCGPFQFAPLIADCPLPSACFTPACNAHNLCYVTCGASKKECDNRFYLDMMSICASATVIERSELEECQRLALIYWAAVFLFGDQAFEDSQWQACARDELVQEGACCAPPLGTCGDGLSSRDCDEVAGVFFSGMSCVEVEERFGGCPTPPNDLCDDRERVCVGQQPDADLGRCVMERDRGLPESTCSVSVQDCFPDEVCLPFDEPAYFCDVETDTRLATTDGPAAGGDCAESGAESFQADVWYEYVAPCSGTLKIQMCNRTFYDAMLAVYGANEPGFPCVCPTDNDTLLACNDDACSPAGGAASALILEDVVEGACYTIRVGGWSSDGAEEGAARGEGALEITVMCSAQSTGQPGDSPPKDCED